MKRSIWYLALILVAGCASIERHNDYDITNFGAVGNGKTLTTSAIQKAIDACHQNGGGTVYFPPGNYLSGSIYLKDKVSLKFASGALLQGSPNLGDYTGKNKCLIYGYGLRNVSITGEGIIDGNGHVFWDKALKALERPEPWILLDTVEHLTLSGLLFRNSPSHTLRVENAHDVTIDNVSMISSFRGPNTDGIDIVDSENFMISNCYISTGDDAICLKSQRDTVQNVVVTNCILESDDAAIKFGTGSRVATRYCSFVNNVIKRSRYGIALFMLDGGVFEHNNFSHLIIETGSRWHHEYPVYIDIDKRKEASKYGIVRDNTFSNLKMVSGGKVLIAGRPDHHISNLRFTNTTFYLKEPVDFSKAKKPRGNKNYPKLETSIDLSPKAGTFTFGYIDDLVLESVEVISEAFTKRPDWYFEEVKKAKKANFTGLN